MNRSSARHIIVKLEKYKDKERILKAPRDKQALAYKDRHMMVVADLYTETWQARKEWQEIFNVMNKKNTQPRILLPRKSVIENRRTDKGFPKQTKTEGIHHH